MSWPEIAGDGRFFQRSGPHSLSEVAKTAEAELSAGDRMISGVAPLQTAAPDEVSFLDNAKYADALTSTRAGAVLVRHDVAKRVPDTAVPLVTPDPYAAWSKVAALFHPLPPVRAGVHPAAVVDQRATIDPSAEVGPLAVIGADVTIGARCRIGAGAVIGDGVVIGPDCRIGAQVTLSHALIGARVVVYPGARIGQDGFGFAVTAQGFLSVPQIGRVIVEDDVEVGANTTIDRGSLRDTVIGAGSRLDNLVQIGHNVRVGRLCVIVAQVGISGSCILEDHVMIAGQAGVAGHLRIGQKARIGAQSGVMSEVPAGAEWVGSPAMPAREVFRQIATLKRLARRPPREQTD